MMKLLLTLFVLSFSVMLGHGQSLPNFWDDVQTIKKYDKIYAPPASPVLFVGSSSIRKWDALERTFAPYRAMNRGVGGMVISDLIYFLPDLVFAYHPHQIIIYVGENDLPAAAETADTILNRTVKLIGEIRRRLPNVPIAYIAMKPSPSRDQFMRKAKQANLLIRNWLSAQPNAQFIDIYPLMLSAQGKSRPELFGPDMLHMNPAGYAIWEKEIRPYLLK